MRLSAVQLWYARPEALVRLARFLSVEILACERCLPSRLCVPCRGRLALVLATFANGPSCG